MEKNYVGEYIRTKNGYIAKIEGKALLTKEQYSSMEYTPC